MKVLMKTWSITRNLFLWQSQNNWAVMLRSYAEYYISIRSLALHTRSTTLEKSTGTIFYRRGEGESSSGLCCCVVHTTQRTFRNCPFGMYVCWSSRDCCQQWWTYGNCCEWYDGIFVWCGESKTVGGVHGIVARTSRFETCYSNGIERYEACLWKLLLCRIQA